LASHSLYNYQKMERMMKLPPLGDSKPSVMLAEMLEFCPAGESTTAVFTYLFLQRLPREICVLLSEDDPADVLAIADKADRLIAMHVSQGHEACAAVAGGEDSDPGEWVAAAQGGGRSSSCRPTSAPNSSSKRAMAGARTPLASPEPAGQSAHVHVLLSREIR
jgi:hypothetical protein